MSTADQPHIPVLYEEVLDALDPQDGHLYIDGTLGAGGHTRGILERGGRVLAFDWDPNAIAYARQALAEFGEQVQFINASYAEMGQLAPEHGFGRVDGILMDLGLSSRQVDDPERGFSFRFDAPLDMRFDPRRGRTAADLVNSLSIDELADILWEYGDVKGGRYLARLIAENRPIHTTKQLADLIADNYNTRRRIHPATLVFQALRIAVNGELDALEKGLSAAVDLLKSGAPTAVISFHSLEDRFVKHTFRRLSDPYYKVPKHVLFVEDDHIELERVTRKPITPTAEEIDRNPRSRSAKLRVARKR